MSILKKSIEVDILKCEKITFDYIVIGSGASGVATALTLAEKNFNILVIESGPLLITEHVGSCVLRNHPSLLKTISQECSAQAIWQADQTISHEQVWSVAGGRTLFWGGHTPRFYDFEFTDWPIDFKLIEKNYAWAEKMLQVNDTFFANEIEEKLIKNLCNRDIVAQRSPLALEYQSPKKSTLPRLFASSISMLLSDKHFTNDLNQVGIHLLCDSRALKLESKNDRINGVKVIDSYTGKNHILSAKNYILACGAFRSTKLVIDSSLNISSQHFKKYVGEHIFCKGLIELNKPLEKPIYIYIPTTRQYNFMFEIQGPFHKTWYDANYATVWLDWQSNSQYLLLYGFGVADISGSNVIESSSSNSIYQIKYNYTPKDYDTIESMKFRAAQLAKHLDGKLIDIELQPPGGSLHERGGMIMSNHEKDGVVSTAGKFWNYCNLYCTDTAVWPNQGAANSCLSITAVAHHITKQIMNLKED